MKDWGKYFFLWILLCLFTVGCGGKQEVPRHEDGRAIVYISYMTNSLIEQGMAEFNKTNPDYYIEVWNKDDKSEPLYYEREEMALTTGGGPDLFSHNQMANFVDYVEKGITEDLMPYVKRDFASGELMDCCLYAYSGEGKVYGLEPEFAVTTLLGAKDILKERTRWNVSDVKQLMEKNPQIPMFENNYFPNAGEFLRIYLGQGGGVYRDYETLREVLELDIKYHGCLPDDVPERVGENVMVINSTMTDPLDYVDLETCMGKELVPIGYPGEESGNIHEGGALSINSASGQKEGAWEFIKYLLSYDFQKEYNKYSISPRRDLFEEKLEYYSKPITYTVCIDGEEIEITKGHRLNRSSSITEDVEVECATPEQIEKFRDMVEHSKTRWELHDYNAVCIIREEADAFFENRRSLDEVMDSIQNRMELYYAEKGNP